MDLAGDAAGAAQATTSEAELISASLESLHGRENELLEAFYDLFFARHPEVRPLFGEHSVSEKEEMLRETLVSVLAHADEEPWLDENLVAMGRSHAEYGVEGPHYPAFVAAMLDTIEGLGLEGWSPAVRAAWCGALERLTSVMREAGAEAGGVP